MFSVPGDAERAGAGSQVLLLIANPLTARVLRAHAAGPVRPSALYRELGWSAQTTIRTCVANLVSAGALLKHEIGGSPYAVENELTPAGHEMIVVAAAVDAWLALAPEGPVLEGTSAARVAIRAMVGGWSSEVMQTLAGAPHSLTELDDVISALSYPVLKRRLTALRLSQQVTLAVDPEGGSLRPYGITDWLRQSIAPIAAASRFESRFMETTTLRVTDAEMQTAMMLTVPLAVLSARAEGTCTMGIEARAGALILPGALAGVTVGAKAGLVASCVAGVDEGRSRWALGTAATWLDVLIDGHLGTELRIADAAPGLVTDVVRGTHLALFDRPKR